VLLWSTGFIGAKYGCLCGAADVPDVADAVSWSRLFLIIVAIVPAVAAHRAGMGA
jgi:hypothetical protein